MRMRRILRNYRAHNPRASSALYDPADSKDACAKDNNLPISFSKRLVSSVSPSLSLEGASQQEEEKLSYVSDQQYGKDNITFTSRSRIWDDNDDSWPGDGGSSSLSREYSQQTLSLPWTVSLIRRVESLSIPTRVMIEGLLLSSSSPKQISNSKSTILRELYRLSAPPRIGTVSETEDAETMCGCLRSQIFLLGNQYQQKTLTDFSSMPTSNAANTQTALPSPLQAQWTLYTTLAQPRWNKPCFSDCVHVQSDYCAPTSSNVKIPSATAAAL